MNTKQPVVYMMANKQNGTIYTGMTSNIIKRAYEHRNALISGFSKKYDCKLLVFFEVHPTMNSAICREKQIKSGTRKRKLKLIESMNPSWKDLYKDII